QTLAAAGPHLVPIARYWPGPSRATHGPGMGPLRRAGSRPSLSACVLCGQPASVGPGRGAACRCRTRRGCLRARPGPECVLLAARCALGRLCDGAAGPPGDQQGGSPVAEPGADQAPSVSLLVPEVLD